MKVKLLMMIISVIVMVAGTLITISSFSRKRETPPEAQLSSVVQDPVARVGGPHNGWEVNFFPALEERIKQIGLPKLETSVERVSDLELRYWYDASPETINGLVIRRFGDDWSARWIRQSREGWPSRVTQERLDVPKSGWTEFWTKVTDSGILTMPDGEEINCTSGVLDGAGLVVEVLTHQGYRTYRYDNPQRGACAEAKQMMRIEGIMADEFSLHRFSVK